MEGKITAIINICIVVVLLVIAPLYCRTLFEDFQLQTKLYNETTNFVDKVSDAGEITEDMLSDFYTGCSSVGVMIDVNITRHSQVVNPYGDTLGKTRTTWVKHEDTNVWNKGDFITVDVKCISFTTAQKLTSRIFGLSADKIAISVTKMIRQ